jgi:hypothetical protein
MRARWTRQRHLKNQMSRMIRVAAFGLVVGTLVGIIGITTGCGLLGREYEYEEQVYLDADGSATVVVDSSVPALVALRGLPIDPSPTARLDREEIRRVLAAGGCQVTRIGEPWRRHGRRFIQIRLSTADVRDLSRCRLTSWSTYSGLVPFPDGTTRYQQRIGDAAGTSPGKVNWDGSEIVGFKLHLPSRILEHNAQAVGDDPPREPERGNILTWEQRLAERRAGVPIAIDVRMDQHSILARTLMLFGGAFLAALLTVGAAVWRTARHRNR